jgi:hypothetical protein
MNLSKPLKHELGRSLYFKMYPKLRNLMTNNIYVQVSKNMIARQLEIQLDDQLHVVITIQLSASDPTNEFI